jgi:hypothetical protein
MGWECLETRLNVLCSSRMRPGTQKRFGEVANVYGSSGRVQELENGSGD